MSTRGLLGFADGDQSREIGEMSIKAFIKKYHIRMRAEYADENPNMTDKMMDGSTHWKCTFRRGNRQLTTYYSSGPAFNKPPTAAEVLECLQPDSMGMDNARTFEDWAAKYGYDPDSRRAEATYKVCRRQAQKLERFISEHWAEFLDCE